VGAPKVMQPHIFQPRLAPEPGQTPLQRCHRNREKPVVAFFTFNCAQLRCNRFHLLGTGNESRLARLGIANLHDRMPLRNLPDVIPRQRKDFRAAHPGLVGPHDIVLQPPAYLLRHLFTVSVLLEFNRLGCRKNPLPVFLRDKALARFNALQPIRSIRWVAIDQPISDASFMTELKVASWRWTVAAFRPLLCAPIHRFTSARVIVFSALRPNAGLSTEWI